MSYEKIARVPTFITVDIENEQGQTNKPRPNSAKKTKRTKSNNPQEDILSSDSVNDNDIEQFIKILLNRVITKLADPELTRTVEDDDERRFMSPIEARSVEKADVFYTPRSDRDGDRLGANNQDDFEDNGSLEFALKDIPIQEDPVSPVKYDISAQLLAEIDETLNSILNLDESSDTIVRADDEDADSSILIEYSDNPLDQIIADYVEYFKERSITESVDTAEESVKPIVDDVSEYPLTEEMEESFNALLGMSEKEGYDITFQSPLGNSALSNGAAEDIFLRAGLSDLEDVPGTDLHRSLKTPDATKDVEKTMEPNRTHSSISTDDDESTKGYLILNDSEINEAAKNYEKFNDRLLNEKQSSKLDVEPVLPEVVEMECKTQEASRSFEETPFRSRSPVRKRSRASTFFRRAASALGLFKTRSWSPREDDPYHVAVGDEDGKIEVITTSFGGESHTKEVIKSETLPRTKEKLSLSEISECNVNTESDKMTLPSRLPKRRLLTRLTGTGTQSLPRSTGRAWSFFKIHS